MSTRQYQIYADLAIARDELEQRMKNARKEFIEHIRATGVAARKIFVPDNNRTTITSINVRCTDWSEGTTATGCMEFWVCSDVPRHKIDLAEMQQIKDWLLSKGWAIKSTTQDRGEFSYIFICI